MLGQDVGRISDPLPSALSQGRIRLKVVRIKPIHTRCFTQTCKKIRKAEPADAVVQRSHAAKCHLSIQSIHNAAEKGGLNGMCRRNGLDIVRQLFSRCTNIAHTHVLVLRSTCTTKNLEHIQDPQIHHFTLLSIVDIRAFDDHRIRWQINTPCKCRRAAKHTSSTRSKETLTQVAIRAQHACIVNAYAVLKQFTQFSVPARRDIALETRCIATFNKYRM